MTNNKNSNNLLHRFLDKYHQHHGQNNITVTDTTTPENDTSSLNSKQEKELNTFTSMVYDTFGNKDWKQQQLIKCLREAQWDSQQALLDMKDIQDAFYGLLSIPPTANSSLKLLGSENDQGTSCYLDALLFAMYIGFTCFDPMLIGDPFEPSFSLPASPIDHNHRHSTSSSSSSSSYKYKHDNRHLFFKKHRKKKYHHKRHYPQPPSTAPLSSLSSTSRRHRFFTTFKKPSAEKEKQQQLERELTLALPLKDIDTEEDFKPQQHDIAIENELSDIEKKHHLQRTLRLFVNKLRKGRLVKSRTVYQVRLALTENGWYGPDPHSNMYQQEDVTELFLFLTSIFELPYLPFQLRLFHGANKDVDDDRIMTDRVLLLCLPPAIDHHQQQLNDKDKINTDNTIKLETILVDHFYNSIVTGVKRHVDMGNNEETTNSTDSLLNNLDQNAILKNMDQNTTKHTYNDGDDDSDGESIDKIEIILKEYKKNVKNSNCTKIFTTSPGSPLKYKPNDSDSKNSNSNSSSCSSISPLPPRLITEVQAWQAMELLPFYSSSNEQGDMINYDQYSFPDTHLILPIVLKRYHINNGLYVKDQRVVQVPDTIPFHQFVNQNMENVICSQCHDNMDYSMSLKSVVCHYGSSPLSGHYIAYAKLPNQSDDQQQQKQDLIHMNCSNSSNYDKKQNDTMGNRYNTKNDESFATWMKLDDLNVKNRVEHVESDQVFDQISKHGYLFFYELTRVCDHCIQENLKRSSFLMTNSPNQEQPSASIKSSISTSSFTSSIQKDNHAINSTIGTTNNNNNNMATNDNSPIISTVNTEKSRKSSEKCSIM